MNKMANEKKLPRNPFLLATRECVLLFKIITFPLEIHIK